MTTVELTLLDMLGYAILSSFAVAIVQTIVRGAMARRRKGDQ